MKIKYPLLDLFNRIKGYIKWFSLSDEEKMWEEFNRDYVKYNDPGDI